MPGSTPNPLQVGGGKGLRIAIGVLGALVAVAVVVVGVLLVSQRGDDDKRTTDDATSSETQESDGKAPSTLDLPTIDPSDFPSDFSSIDPSDFPSVNPSFPDLPGNGTSIPPSELFSGMPTDPSQVESWFSDYLGQMQ